jgi:hypothetical protein
VFQAEQEAEEKSNPTRKSWIDGIEYSSSSAGTLKSSFDRNGTTSIYTSKEMLTALDRFSAHEAILLAQRM